MAEPYKRGRIWWGRVQRQGREYRRSLKTKDKAKARERLAKWTDELDAVAFGEKPPRTFDEAVDKFMNEHLPTLRPSSARRYGVSLVHLTDDFAGKFLSQISSAGLNEFETRRRTAGVMAPTVRRDLACLSSLLGCAVDWEWIDSNPVPAYLKRRRKRGLRESPPRTRYLSLNEEARLLAHATPVVRLAIAFAIDTGLRREEQFSLTWDRIDGPARLIRLGNETKSGVGREVPILPRAARILAQMPRHIRSPYVFRHGDGKRYADLDKGFYGAIRRAKLPGVRWHDLRRTFGCRRLQDDGKDMKEVSDMLGHHSVVVTEQRYAFLKREKAAQSLTETGTGSADS